MPLAETEHNLSFLTRFDFSCRRAQEDIFYKQVGIIQTNQRPKEKQQEILRGYSTIKRNALKMAGILLNGVTSTS